jgi:hypothetical protein
MAAHPAHPARVGVAGLSRPLAPFAPLPLLHVRTLRSMRQNSLTGPFPAELFEATSPIQELTLVGNTLSGTIPTEIGTAWTSLTKLFDARARSLGCVTTRDSSMRVARTSVAEGARLHFSISLQASVEGCTFPLCHPKSHAPHTCRAGLLTHRAAYCPLPPSLRPACCHPCSLPPLLRPPCRLPRHPYLPHRRRAHSHNRIVSLQAPRRRLKHDDRQLPD